MVEELQFSNLRATLNPKKDFTYLFSKYTESKNIQYTIFTIFEKLSYPAYLL